MLGGARRFGALRGRRGAGAYRGGRPPTACKGMRPYFVFALLDLGWTKGTHLFFPLHASVLIPGLDLQLGQAEPAGQRGSLSARQVFLLLETALQLAQMLLREHRAVSTALDSAREKVAGARVSRTQSGAETRRIARNCSR